MSGACSPLPSWKYTCVLPVQLHVFPASKALQHCLCNPQCSAQVSRGTVCAVSIQGRPLLQNNNPSIPLAWLVRQPHIGSSRGTLCLIEHSHSLSAFLPSSFWKYSLPCQYQICPCLPRPEMYQDLSCFSPFCLCNYECKYFLLKHPLWFYFLWRFIFTEIVYFSFYASNGMTELIEV